MPATIVFLVLVTRRLRRREERLGSRPLLSQEPWPYSLGLVGALNGVLGAQAASGWDPLKSVGVILGAAVTLLIWAGVDPVAHDRRFHVASKSSPHPA